MPLPKSLVDKFVKATKETKKSTNKERTVYGTISEKCDDGTYMVLLDGATSATKIAGCTAGINLDETTNKDRLIITIKNNQAYITGNLSAPSVTSSEVAGTVTENIGSVPIDKIKALWE